MELVSIIGVVMRHRLLLLVGVAAAVAIAVVAAQRLAPSTANGDVRGVAAARVLIDERRSLVPDLRPLGPLTIATRASMLADLLADDAATRTMAAAAGVRRSDLAVLAPSMGAPAAVGPLPDRAGQAEVDLARAHRYTVDVQQEPTLPVLVLEAHAPDRASAARLAVAATTALRSVIDAQASKRRPGVVARQLGPVRSARVPVGGAAHPVLAFVGALFFLVMWCAGIVVGSGVLRAARRSARRLKEASAPAR